MPLHEQLLEQARHLADYDLGETFYRNDVLSLIDDIEQRIEDWRQIEGDPTARLFLVSLLVWERIRRHS